MAVAILAITTQWPNAHPSRARTTDAVPSLAIFGRSPSSRSRTFTVTSSRSRPSSTRRAPPSRRRRTTRSSRRCARRRCLLTNPFDETRLTNPFDVTDGVLPDETAAGAHARAEGGQGVRHPVRRARPAHAEHRADGLAVVVAEGPAKVRDRRSSSAPLDETASLGSSCHHLA